MNLSSSVLARWAYSEIIDTKSSHAYDNWPGVEALRAKRRAGIDFSKLSVSDRFELASMCEQVRSGLMRYISAVHSFQLTDLTKPRLAALYVPGNISLDLNGRSEMFGTFMQLPRADLGDARGVVEPVAGYQASTEPLTIGRRGTLPVLIDGYHHACAFWKSAPPDAVIAAYEPSERTAP